MQDSTALPPLMLGGSTSTAVDGNGPLVSTASFQSNASILDASNALPASNKGHVGVVIEGAVYWAGFRDVNNIRTVVENRICAFLCVAEEVSMPSFITKEDLDSGAVRFMKISMADDAKTALQLHFAQAFRYLDACRVASMPVVVYCKKGQSRSASIVAAYIMREYNMRFTDALLFLRRSRKADPNFAFCQQLDAFGDAPQERLREDDDALPPPLAFCRSSISERIVDASTRSVANRIAPTFLPSYFQTAMSSMDSTPKAWNHHRKPQEMSVLQPFNPMGDPLADGVSVRGRQMMDVSCHIGCPGRTSIGTDWWIWWRPDTRPIWCTTSSASVSSNATICPRTSAHDEFPFCKFWRHRV